MVYFISYNETDFKTGIGYSNSTFSSVLRYNYNKLDIGIPEDGIAEQSSSKDTQFPRQGIFNHLLSLNNVIYFGHSKLDVDLNNDVYLTGDYYGRMVINTNASVATNYTTFIIIVVT